MQILLRSVLAILAGAVSAIIAVLLHQTIPPLGVSVSLLSSATFIWAIGRYTGKRAYKFLAACAWLAAVLRAGFFGVAQELLLQGDGVGTALLFIGTPLVFAVAIKRA